VFVLKCLKLLSAETRLARVRRLLLCIHPQYIRACLNHVFQTTFTNEEVVVIVTNLALRVDDGPLKHSVLLRKSVELHVWAYALDHFAYVNDTYISQLNWHDPLRGLTVAKGRAIVEDAKAGLHTFVEGRHSPATLPWKNHLIWARLNLP